MKYQPACDIWAVPVDLLRHAQRGQAVYAGTRDNRGVFWGVKPSGTVVVAWLGNSANHADRRAYHRALRAYALGR